MSLPHKDASKPIWHTNQIGGKVNNLSGSRETQSNPEETKDDTALLEELHSGHRNWFWSALITTFVCFPPTGIVAVVSARKANKSFDEGNLQAWKRFNGRARFFVFLTMLMGLVVYGVVFGAVKTIKQ